jgi:hypothetical protein
MAIKLNVEPNCVWGFYPNKSVSDKFIEYLNKYGWKTVPRVPVFRVPALEELNAFNVPNLTREHEYFLLDGNQRLNAAILRKELLPVLLFEPTDNIDYRRDHLSNSRTLTYPRRFEVLCHLYAHRNSPNRGLPSREA